MIKLKVIIKLNKKLNKNITIRNQKFTEFTEEFRLSKKFDNFQKLTEESEQYTDFIVGSDQLWLPVNVVGNYYTLNFVPENINKISYATSFGISQIPKKYREQYVQFLSKINYLSVREDSGKEIIKELINKEAVVVCDPTLLLKKEEWEKLESKNYSINNKYIFCYFLGKNIKHRKFVERLREKTGYKIVSINHCDEYVKYSDKFADIIPYDVGPSEFLKLIKNAEYVCTDSFHGTMFSLIYNKQFFSFRRHMENLKMSTNSRISSILKILNLEQRLLTGDETIDNVDKQIQYDTINKRIDDFRGKSIDFLKKSLNIK